MENTSYESNQTPGGNPASDHASDQQETRSEQSRAGELFESIRSAILQGAEDARRAAEEAIPKVKAAASAATYLTVYGLAYAAVFHWTVAMQLTPDSVKEGCRDGANAGRDAAQELMRNLKRRQAEATSTPPPAGPVGEAAQPSPV